MKKIYIYSGYFEYGSASCNRLLAYAKGFNSLGYESEIVAYDVYRMREYREQSVIINRLCPNKITNKYLRFLIGRCRLILHLLKRNKRDYLMIYSPGLDLFAFLLTRRTNVRVEITECPEVVKPFLIPLCLYYWLLRRIKGMFVISNNLKDFFVSKGIKESNIHIINMIVDTSRFESVERKKTVEPYLAYCGLVSKTKDGVDGLLQSFSIYHKKFPDRKLKIIGRFLEGCSKNDFDDFINDNQLGGVVEFTGIIPPSEMPTILSNAEMLLLDRPNNKQAFYGFPTKLGEYLSTRKPVVVTDVGNIGLFLKNKVNAILVNPDSPEDFSEGMIWCSENPEKAQEIGEMGFEAAKYFFNSINESNKIIDIFENGCQYTSAAVAGVVYNKNEII